MKVDLIPNSTTQAVATLLQPYCNELTPSNLLDAIKSYGANNTNQEASLPSMMTRHEVANYLKCSLPTVDRYKKSGKLKSVKISHKMVKITSDSVLALMGQEVQNA